MSTYVITGVGGFLGSAVARELINQGATVRGLDNLSTGNLENLHDVLRNIDLHVGDICDQTEFARLCRGADCVIHYAAAGTQSQAIEDLSGTNRNNLEGTLKVLIAARDAGVRRVVLASSNSLYATNTHDVKHESMPLSLGSAYAVSKRAAEEYAQCFHRLYGLETVSLRYFHVYGPRQDVRSRYSAAVMRLISEILHGETPTIYGDGETVRDLVYIDDAVEATLRACTVPGFRVAGRIINVGSGRGISLNQVFSELRKVLDYGGVLVYGPERRAQVRNLVADTTLARQALGFVAQEYLSNGISACAKWVQRRANLSNLAVQ
jgi:UDP-glucose 4-epimerase